MNITLNTYISKAKEKINYAIIIAIIAVVLQFCLNFFYSKKIDYSLNINLYKLIALSNVSTDIAFPIENQIQNLVYKIEDDANSSGVIEIENIKCTYGNNLFSCIRKNVKQPDDEGKNLFKIKLEKIIKKRLSTIFDEEISLIDDKIYSITNLYQKVEFSTNNDGSEITSSLGASEIDVQNFEKFKLLKDKQYFESEMKNEAHFQLQPLTFLKNSLIKYSVELESTPIRIVVKESNMNDNYVLTALITFMGYLLFVFLSIKEKE